MGIKSPLFNCCLKIVMFIAQCTNYHNRKQFKIFFIFIFGQITFKLHFLHQSKQLYFFRVIVYSHQELFLANQIWPAHFRTMSGWNSKENAAHNIKMPTVKMQTVPIYQFLICENRPPLMYCTMYRVLSLLWMWSIRLLTVPVLSTLKRQCHDIFTPSPPPF